MDKDDTPSPLDRPRGADSPFRPAAGDPSGSQPPKPPPPTSPPPGEELPESEPPVTPSTDFPSTTSHHSTSKNISKTTGSRVPRMPPRAAVLGGLAITAGILLIVFLTQSSNQDESSDQTASEVIANNEEIDEAVDSQTEPEESEEPTSPTDEEMVDLYAPPEDLGNVVESSKEVIIQVWCNVGDEWKTGTGWPLETANGVVYITNHHVVEGCETSGKNYVELLEGDSQETGDYWPAEVIAYDRGKDLAVIKSDLNLKPLKTSSDLKVGHWVMAVGNPEGLIKSVNFGAVSNIAEVEPSWASKIEAIYTDAAINQGNSGGPLINSAGEVIGIISGGSVVAQNLNFAIRTKELCSRLFDCDNDYVPLALK